METRINNGGNGRLFIAIDQELWREMENALAAKRLNELKINQRLTNAEDAIRNSPEPIPGFGRIQHFC